MLAELSIKNFAIIEQMSLSFETGLTVFTGETGAGKSIIIDAIQLLAGGRGSAEFVRYGEKKAEIEGLFFVDDEHRVISMLAEHGIETTEGTIVLQRDISHTGKSICRINHKLVTLSILRSVGAMLIDIHGQHEHQSLMQKENHSVLLDNFGKDSIQPALTKYEALYDTYTKLKLKQKRFLENEQKMAHRLDLIRYQLKEIYDADLTVDEDVRLEDEKLKLSNYEKLYDALGSAYEELSQENGGLYWVANAMKHLEDVSGIDKELHSIYEAVANSFYVLEDVVFQLKNKWDSLEFDPERLNTIENRLNLITNLKRKYGGTIQEIINYAKKIETELDSITNREQHLAKIEENLQKITDQLQTTGEKLRRIRKQVAKTLSTYIQKELKSLHMDKTKVNIQFSPLDNYTKNGLDEIEFYISTNPGEPLKPLAKIASGGELSRIMLALKTIFSNNEGTTSIIFDEVDTGVGGRVAQAMAEKIQKLSLTSQVFCITHLPQVAATADHHLFISKQTTDENRTITNVIRLNADEKVKEVARMISGVKMTNLTKQHAEELIELASKIKHNSRKAIQ